MGKESTPKIASSLLLGFILALLAMGLPMIGVTVNLYLGAFIFLAAFLLLAYGFWIWEKSSGWHKALRVTTVVVGAIIYFYLVGSQIHIQYKKDNHPQIAKSNPPAAPPVAAPRLPPPPTPKYTPKLRRLKLPNTKNPGSTDNSTSGVTGSNIPPQQNEDSIVNNAPNKGNQTLEDNRKYGTPTPPPHVRILDQIPIAPEVPEVDTSTNAVMRKIHARQARRDEIANPGVQLTITIDQAFYSPAFSIKCSAPCHIKHGAMNINSQSYTFGSTKDPATTNISFEFPKQMPSGEKLTFVIRSNDSTPITILDAGPYAPPIE